MNSSKCRVANLLACYFHQTALLIMLIIYLEKKLSSPNSNVYRKTFLNTVSTKGSSANYMRVGYVRT